MDFKEKEKSFGHLEKQSILFINERKLDYHQTFCQKKNGIIYLRHLGKKSRSQELSITFKYEGPQVVTTCKKSGDVTPMSPS